MKNKTASIIHNQMVNTPSYNVSKCALKIANLIQGKKIGEQVLGLIALLVLLVNKYGLNVTEMLNMADNMVFSNKEGFTTNINFKALESYINKNWSL